MSDTRCTNMIRSLHEIPTPLNTVFFSDRNINAIQKELYTQIFNKIQYKIDRQDDNVLLQIMRGIYIENDVDARQDIQGQIHDLNALVVKVCLPQIASGLKAYKAYVRDASSLPEPISRGISTNQKGQRQLQPNIGF
jgi:Family of unknown function (DUF5761)